MKIKKKWLFIIPLIIAIVTFLSLYYYFNKEDQNSFTVADNKWIKENQATVVDFSILSDYPVFGNGGVFRRFIDDFSKDTGFEFNVVPFLKESVIDSKGYRFRILTNKEVLSEKDLFLQEEVYALIGKEKGRYDSINEVGSKTFGILANDSDEIIYYLKSYGQVKYKTYEEADKLFEDYEKDAIDMIIIPNTMYLNETILKEDFHIKYIFTDFSRSIVLSLSDKENDSRMNEIVTKYFKTWKKNNYVSVYNKMLLDYYINAANINDKEKTEFLTKNYIYGYVENYPYEVKDKKELSGIAAEYIGRMQRLMSDKVITFNKYDTLEALKEAINKGEVDIYFNYYDFEHSNYVPTISPFIEKYVVLGKAKDKFVVNTFESTKGRKVYLLENNAIYNYFKDSSKAALVPAQTLDSLLKSSNGNLVVVDKEVYNYYKNNKFSDYEILFESTITKDYNFMVKNDDSNKVLHKIFDYIISTNSYYNYRNEGLSSLNLTLLEKSSFEELYVILFVILIIPIIAILVVILILRSFKEKKYVKKEERRKYTDMLTSLKNRNYLNFSKKLWNDSDKYPQGIIVIDLNNVKYVNDNYGYDQGDKLIIGAASILVNTQLEKTEIIRTDGNEFLIYLVGYSEQQVTTYAKKISKELKTLPYGFGAAIGFSMIIDEIKTIDDAINEATLEMRKDKEEYK